MDDNIISIQERLNPKIRNAAAAREAITKRFIEAAGTETPDPPQGPSGLIGYLSMSSIKPRMDGSLAVTIYIPQAMVKDAMEILPLYARELPLAISLENIDLNEFIND